MTIPETLRNSRLKRDLSLRDVAEALEIPESTYRGYECGSKLPAELVPKICHFFGIEIQQFFQNARPTGHRDLLAKLSMMENYIREIRAHIQSTANRDDTNSYGKNDLF
ncbi:MAG: helix-turn-helix transcriptional regulator [Pseudomonadota bacterium]